MIPRRLTFDLPALYGAVHLCVDLTTVSSVFVAGRQLDQGWLTPFALILAYDIAAFALQFPLGLVLDRWRLARAALLSGLALCGVAALSVAVSPWATLVAAGLGNALFHVGAGSLVLQHSRGLAAPAGLFVAPGAVGLALGLAWGRGWETPSWPLALVMAVSIALVAWWRVPDETPREGRVLPANLPWGAALLVLGLLLLSVTVRSFVGFAAPFDTPRTLVIALGLPAAAFTGKLLGGFASDRWGWLETGVGVLLLSAPLIAFGGGTPWALILGLLLFQATMPVTLVAMFRLFPRNPATAFGLPCFALILGALPTFWPEGQGFYSANLFLALILVSAVAVFAALVRLGIGRGYRPAVSGASPVATAEKP